MHNRSCKVVDGDGVGRWFVKYVTSQIIGSAIGKTIYQQCFMYICIRSAKAADTDMWIN